MFQTDFIDAIFSPYEWKTPAKLRWSRDRRKLMTQHTTIRTSVPPCLSWLFRDDAIGVYSFVYTYVGLPLVYRQCRYLLLNTCTAIAAINLLHRRKPMTPGYSSTAAILHSYPILPQTASTGCEWGCA
jgi:hypothetical protein